jgi:hypothetical protein
LSAAIFCVAMFIPSGANMFLSGNIIWHIAYDTIRMVFQFVAIMLTIGVYDMSWYVSGVLIVAVSCFNSLANAMVFAYFLSIAQIYFQDMLYWLVLAMGLIILWHPIQKIYVQVMKHDMHADHVYTLSPSDSYDLLCKLSNLARISIASGGMTRRTVVHLHTNSGPVINSEIVSDRHVAPLSERTTGVYESSVPIARRTRGRPRASSVSV